MSGAGSAGDSSQSVPANANPDALEVVSGAARQKIEGWVPELANEQDLAVALEQAFDYRGDITITRKDGSKIEGYIFDRHRGSTLADSAARLLSKDSNRKESISYADIARLEFSGRDTASGKSWEAWVRKYWEKRAAGQKGIQLKPESIE